LDVSESVTAAANSQGGRSNPDYNHHASQTNHESLRVVAAASNSIQSTDQKNPEFVELGQDKRASVTLFKGKHWADLREYYEVSCVLSCNSTYCNIGISM
jgi:hypothetical protein